jgi:DNA-binding SARP family transcriptional activator
MSRREARVKVAADFEYERDEGVRTLVNAINLLHASEPDDYRFWSAFYKFAVDNGHRVLMESEYRRLREVEAQLRARQAQDAAEAIKAFNDAKQYVRSPKVQWTKE